ncbi:MAG: SGNH/GDSL hydrolase family protein [Opitutus sp.]
MPVVTLLRAFGSVVVAVSVSLIGASAATILGVEVAASNRHFVYEGRFDMTDAAAPAMIWQGSRIRFDFIGDTLVLKFSEVLGQSFFDADIDGNQQVVEFCEGRSPVGARFSGLGAGRHHFTLFKRSEAAAGTARFVGATLAPGGEAFSPPASHEKVRFLFIGDSITAGACNEDGATDQWEDRRTHNNALSYGAFTSAAFNADYRNIAVSGMGIVTGYVPMKAGEIWDRVYPRTDSRRADLASRSPDMIFVNLGENDDSFTKVNNQSFPGKAYTDGYIALVSAIREAYPTAAIVILRGGMFGGAQSERLRSPWEAAVAQIEHHDSKATHFVFKHWSSTHPRVSDHRAMADELISWLQVQPFTASLR